MAKISKYAAVTAPADADTLVCVQGGATKNITLRKIADYVDVGSKPFTSATDPLTNAAVTATIVDAYAGTIITLTAGGNAQTIAAPTIITPGKVFTVVNNDTSTHSIAVNGFTITPGEAQSFIWDGTAWGPTDLGITAVPVVVSQGGTGLHGGQRI